MINIKREIKGFTEYLQAREKKLLPNTIKSYIYNTKRFLGCVGKRAITEDIITTYINENHSQKGSILIYCKYKGIYNKKQKEAKVIPETILNFVQYKGYKSDAGLKVLMHYLEQNETKEIYLKRYRRRNTRKDKKRVIDDYEQYLQLSKKSIKESENMV